MTTSGILDWLVLAGLPGIGTVTFWQLLRRFDSPEGVFSSSRKTVSAVLTQRQLDGFDKREEVRVAAEKELKKLARMGGAAICYEDNIYPQLLREIADPPPVLRIFGNPGLLTGNGVAMVGSRAATSYGSRVAFDLARTMAEHDILVVSGMALGIDSAAHEGALNGGGGTVAVLGCGADVVYPAHNKRLYDKLVEVGAVISEYPLGTPPEGFRFPARNRIIAGMSRGVLVVEAAKKSGSLITAQLALDEGRDVYAVPGRVDSYKSAGTHWLLQQGAKLVHSAEDVLEDMAPYASAAVVEKNKQSSIGGLEEKELRLLQHIDEYPISRDELLLSSGMKISTLSESLLLLELEGLVEILPGGEIRRVA